jgi:hypothetical protein
MSSDKQAVLVGCRPYLVSQPWWLCENTNRGNARYGLVHDVIGLDPDPIWECSGLYMTGYWGTCNAFRRTHSRGGIFSQALRRGLVNLVRNTGQRQGIKNKDTGINHLW